MKLMNDKREHFETIIETKLDKVLKKLDVLENNQKATFEQIDKVFEEVI